MSCTVAQPQTPNTDPNIPQIRAASRQLAREWGFFRSTYEDTSLSPAATHCLIEIAERGVATDAGLRHVLRFDNHTLARAVSELVDAGLVEPVLEGSGVASRRMTSRRMTSRGCAVLASIDDMATGQVQTALTTAEAVDPAAAATIVSGLQLYATTLHALRMRQEAAQTARDPLATAASTQPAPQPAAVTIQAGYRPGLLARAMEMNTAYFSTHHGWGMQFEADLSASLADLLRRLDRPMNQAWTAIDARTNRIVGVIFIDGEDLGLPGVAHLRSFIVDDSVRGSGAGKKLIAAAMAFVDEVGFEEVRLNTIRELAAARRLYRTFGFVEAREVEIQEFGMVFGHLQCVWKRPGLQATD
ncbi:hypothetical protein M0657_002583 [Pyricularia oryzae]|uniref:N-acetyltransferase domain-containing protein n=2 Tax=Pyricularia oryzae TaxID=318829 RepID=A0AA97PFW7_PYRO3|nr:hypothetical protein OOU_Y34scaffold01005g94 [Pyricularia oryzae Y34]KAI7928000.1 hypothetical protein M9X92_002064 [Pyricularia oryzae]KAI7928475.1 hypothetical protein M0657_002583 [Pyricularia oryzae]